VISYEFKESDRISTYLYAFIAGPYAVLESEHEHIKNYKYPLRLICRKSLCKYLEKDKEIFLGATKSAIDFYEKLFNTQFPFEKLDQAFVPNHPHEGMENVGLVMYKDTFVR